jgi:hypothetical protein
MTTTAPVITLPTIHSNGDTAQALMDDNRSPMDAISIAISKLARACPNGRNFYPQGDEATSRAIAEHQDRLKRLQSVQDELEAICMHVADFIK